MNTQNIKNVVYGVAGLLVILLVILMGYLFLGNRQSAVVQQVPHVSVGGVTANEALNPFDVGVLSSGAYKKLDRSVLDANKLPVPVPENRGKANLFGV